MDSQQQQQAILRRQQQLQQQRAAAAQRLALQRQRSGQENLPPGQSGQPRQQVQRPQGQGASGLSREQQQLRQKQMLLLQQRRQAQQQQLRPVSGQTPIQQQQPMPKLKPQVPKAPKEPEDPEVHKRVLQELKDKYLETLETMLKWPQQVPGVRNFHGYLTGDKAVEINNEFLNKLKYALERMIEREFVTFPMVEEIRKVELKSKTETDGTEKVEKGNPLEVESWKTVKHLEIRVPEAVRKLVSSRR